MEEVAIKPLEEVEYSQAYVNSIWRQQLDQTLKDRENLETASILDISSMAYWTYTTAIISGYIYQTYDGDFTTGVRWNNATTVTIDYGQNHTIESLYLYIVRQAAGTVSIDISQDNITWTNIGSVTGAFGVTYELSLIDLVYRYIRLVQDAGGFILYELHSIGKKYYTPNYNPLM